MSIVRRFLNNLGLKPSSDFCYALTKIDRSEMNIFEVCGLEFGKLLQLAFKFDPEAMEGNYTDLLKITLESKPRIARVEKKLGVILFQALKDYK